MLHLTKHAVFVCSLQKSEKELPELRVIKEEPPDLDNSYTDQDQTAEIGVYCLM